MSNNELVIEKVFFNYDNIEIVSNLDRKNQIIDNIKKDIKLINEELIKKDILIKVNNIFSPVYRKILKENSNNNRIDKLINLMIEYEECCKKLDKNHTIKKTLSDINSIFNAVKDEYLNQKINKL